MKKQHRAPSQIPNSQVFKANFDFFFIFRADTAANYLKTPLKSSKNYVLSGKLGLNMSQGES